MHHQVGHWSFPKGRVEKGETEIETAKRELIEETGIKDFKILNDLYFIEKYSFEEGNKKYDKEVKYFVALIKDPKVKILESELQDYKWLDFDNALELITFQGAKNILKEVNKIIC
ncbi:NUDIX domain-containing protein [Patescibacteria group bacterium]|nr:NUDIX domain-containing protein [Patescibacteria group bacterium]